MKTFDIKSYKPNLCAKDFRPIFDKSPTNYRRSESRQQLVRNYRPASDPKGIT